MVRVHGSGRLVASVRKRSITAAVAAALVCLLAASAAAASSRTRADDAARKSANAWTSHHYGIGFSTRGGWRMWSASCRRVSGGGWSCGVRINGGQCVGTVQLTSRLHGYAHRIGCGE